MNRKEMIINAVFRGEKAWKFIELLPDNDFRYFYNEFLLPVIKECDCLPIDLDRLILNFIEDTLNTFGISESMSIIDAALKSEFINVIFNLDKKAQKKEVNHEQTTATK